VVEHATLVDLLRWRGEHEPDREIYGFLGEGAEAGPWLTCGELDRRARILAAELGRLASSGDRALLLYPPGLDFITAFFGALYGGLVAVAVPPPDPRRLERTLPRLRSVMADARPAVVLTTAEILGGVGDQVKGTADLPSPVWLASDQLAGGRPEAWRPRAQGAGLAYLQYTSGSTSSPKGVMVSHANVLHNSSLIQRAWGYTSASVAVMWVPHFHDDGLVHAIVQPLFTGYRCWLMPSTTFVRQPIRWLRTISRARATHSGGPNFAYALAVQKTTPEERSGLDLGSWRVAYNAAEPVRWHTLEEFARTFAPYGFRPEAFEPAFGLAEATLLVSTGRTAARPVRRLLRPGPLEREHRVVESAPGEEGRVQVSCGRPVPEMDVAIVDPETCERCTPDQVGEIWIAGPSVAQGYWERPLETESTFRARTMDGGSYLRTGDLGFLSEGELFVTGRHKDLIILRGRNLYPQDIELTVERCHPALRAGCGAAFAVDSGGEERLVVVQEIDAARLASAPENAAAAVLDAICQVVAAEHDAALHALVLIEPRTIPKTSSGKIQRRACREEFLAGGLRVVAGWGPGWRPGRPAPADRGRGASDANELEARTGDVVAWLREYAGERLHSRLIDERRTIPPPVLLDLSRRGLLGLQADEALGGLGLRYRDAARIVEQLGAIDLTLATFVIGQNALGLRPVQNHASPSLREELLPDLVSGRKLSAFALSEPGAGSHPRALVTQAVPGRAGWTLHGHKMWIGAAAWASVLHVFARSGPDGGISAFAVRRESAGLHIGPETLTLGLRGMVQNAVELDGVPVAEADRLGSPGAGLEVANDALGISRLWVAAASVGAMKRCAQTMLRWASRRSIATGRLLDHPVTLARLGRLTAAAGALEALISVLAEALDDGEAVPGSLLAAAKVGGSELVWQAADDLVQLLGGRGYVETNVAPQILRDARALRIFEGPTEALVAHLGSEAIRGDGALFAFLRGRLGAPGLADRLRQAAMEAEGRIVRPQGRFAGRPAALLWIRSLLGESVVEAALLAAAEAALRRRPARAREDVATWMRLRFEASLQRVAAGDPAEAVLLDAAGAEERIGSFSDDIGDVEQRLPGAGGALDPWLQRSFAAAVPPPGRGEPPAAGPAVKGENAESVERWLAAWISRRSGLAPEILDPRRPFASYGLDSVAAVALAEELGSWLGRPLDSILAWTHPSPRALALALTAETRPERAATCEPGLAVDPGLERLLEELERLPEEEARRALDGRPGGAARV
jgi:acyl-CoA synthetase (AMP-forming)/AMP-acid ligase II/alkylation response protein AidB-like acyl-CoA dehydrogenase